jgi:rubrerythrin
MDETIDEYYCPTCGKWFHYPECPICGTYTEA